MNRHRTWILICAIGAGAVGCEPEGQDAPVPAGPLVFPDEPFRAMPPVPGPARPFEAPLPELFALPSGVEVVLVERRNLPILTWHIEFPTGALADPPGKEGLASLCLNAVFQGSKTLDRGAREQALADMGASIDLSVTASRVSVSASCLRPDLETTLPMWADLFQQPALDPNVFAGTLRARLAGLTGGPALTPGAVAGRVSARLFWGMGHPFVREVTMESLGATVLADCQGFVASLRPMGARLFIAGDISRAEVEARFGASLNGPAAPAGLAPAPLEVPAPATATGSVFFVDAPGAPQSIVTLRAPGPARASPDFYPAQLMAAILAGDSITSRIGMNVREMKGYAYALNGGFVYDRQASYFDFAAPVVKDATAQSVFEVLEEIRRMREEEVTELELARERDAVLGGLPYQFETGRGTLNSYGSLFFYGLPLDTYRGYPAGFGGVTTAAIRQAAAQHLRPGSLQILVVGDGASVLPKLRELAAQRPDLMGREVVTLDHFGNRL
jgi:zinc protease